MVFAAAQGVKVWTTQLGLFGGAQWSTAADEGMFVSVTHFLSTGIQNEKMQTREITALGLESLPPLVLVAEILN
jgi:hypothetical protein